MVFQVAGSVAILILVVLSLLILNRFLHHQIKSLSRSNQNLIVLLRIQNQSLLQENQRLVNLVVSTELSTFNSLEVQRKTFNGPLEENSPSGTDLDEYKRWMDNGDRQSVV